MKRVVLWALAGLIAGPFVALGLAMVAIPVFGISQREGAYAMGVVFTLMPLGAVVGCVVGAVWALVRRPR